jgi:hypothetical protein
MTLIENAFTTDNATGVTGFTVVTTAGAGQGSGFYAASGRAQTNNTATNIAYASATMGNDQFVQMQLVNNLGASVSAILCFSGTTAANYSGYQVRHTGTDLAIQKVVAGVSTALGNIAHTRVAGQYMRLTKVGNVLTAYTLTSYNDPSPVQVLQVTDTGTLLTGGTAGFRSGSTSGVILDNFAAGDMSELYNTTGGTSGGTPVTGPITEVINEYNPSGIPPWRGLRFDLSGKMITPGEMLHRQRFDFIGPTGTFTPPTGLTVSSGTATLSGPDAGIGYLELTTNAAVGAKAGLSFLPIASGNQAILIEANAVSFSAANPAADFRIGFAGLSGAGGAAVQLNAADWMFLTSGTTDDSQRTRTAIAINNDDAARRRPIGLLIIPAKKELYLMKRDKVVGYRDCNSSWVDGTTLTPVIEITAQAAVAQKLRLASLTVTTFA